MDVKGETAVCEMKPAFGLPGVLVNSELLGFECRVYQPYNLPTHERSRFVK